MPPRRGTRQGRTAGTCQAIPAAPWISTRRTRRLSSTPPSLLLWFACEDNDLCSRVPRRREGLRFARVPASRLGRISGLTGHICLVHWPAASDDLPGRHLVTEAEDGDRGRRQRSTTTPIARPARTSVIQCASNTIPVAATSPPTTTRAAPILEMPGDGGGDRADVHGIAGGKGIVGFARARNAMAAAMDHASIRPFLGDQPLQKMCRTAVATTLSTR